MSQESGKIAECSGRMAMLFKDLAPQALAERFAFQMKRSPKREKWIARFSAQAILAGFYLQHLEDYERMFKDVFQVDGGEYFNLSEQERVKLKEREQENDKWLDTELAQNINSLGQRISNLGELDVLCRLLRDTQRRIAKLKEHYADYTEFEAQLSFFDEPMKFVLRINEKLGPFIEVIEELEDERFEAGWSIHIRKKPLQVQSTEEIVERSIRYRYIKPRIRAVSVG